MPHPTSPARTSQRLDEAVTGGIGDSPLRPDSTLKVTGEYAYSSDLWAEDMLWGSTLRSPHPYARISSLDISEALKQPGVHAVLTHQDVPGENVYGLKVSDTPVLAEDIVRYQGEPVALVAADHPETARRALAKIVVEYEVLEPVTDPERAAHDDTLPKLHPEGNIVRYQPVVKGDPEAEAEVVVSDVYTMGMQDQAFLGPESGLAIPDEDGGVDLFLATQWLHVDQRQTAHALGLPLEKVRFTMSGVGGAFGGREDLSMQIHCCMLALHTGRPVKMVYDRLESFYGHVHRHPAKMYYEHGATKDGKLVYVKARMYFDGGAYASKTPVVVSNATSLGTGPYVVPNVRIEGWGLYTNNPPCGAMRGLGAVQPAFAYELQMDKLAAALEMDPVRLRQLNAVEEGDSLHTGQVLDSPAPVAELLARLERMPLPPEPADVPRDVRTLPGGLSNTSHGEGVVRGIGYSVIIKNVSYAEGVDDYSTARVRLEVIGGAPVALVHTAAAEVGQGLITVHQQIARTELGVERVTIHPADTNIGDAGSSSASRQTYITGGAVREACTAVREAVFARVAQRFGEDPAGLTLSGGKVVSASGAVLDLVEVLGEEPVEETREYHHLQTYKMDPVTGQSRRVHVQHAYAAHRAVVEVDTELGLVKVVQLDCAQDVGKAVNPDAVVGQIQGGSTQGLGLAVMEEIKVKDGKIRNPSFTDYLIPTILDTPPMRIEVLERADPHSPYGVRGVGEPPTISATPAVVNAIRNATGLNLTHTPVSPEQLCGS
ncbi:MULTISPECIES: xanthine dehydrogenase subunit D [Streptomyces]|uniref:xanthine dehydrogenase subunit D n=1 Tax=Streptomyces TaxID=1883 RepID=UPI001FFED1C7|nr:MULTISPECIES: xanthine dehydrogenase subunit D [Streptomyces]MCK2145080.1 xanthine dehydrogenase subunit D [Streptomyces sp. WAC00276]MCQ9704938.1 xanthine dehydrogenase subunit D [Streptomyces sp. BSP1]MCR0988109.1 xanthine dehydrogenase subunit D [Streptomyces albidoflavus]